MARIICPSASVMPFRFGRKPVVVACSDTCPTCHGDGYIEKKPPKAEKINPSTREMIEAEIAKWNIDGYEGHYVRKGLRIAIECLDKPAEPMVSVEAVRTAYWRTFFDNPVGFQKWMDQQAGEDR